MIRQAANWTKRQVVGRLLLPADQQAPEAVEPGVPDLHDPAARRVARRVGRAGGSGLRRTGLGRDVRRVAVGGGGLAAGVVVVAPVQAQVARRGWPSASVAAGASMTCASSRSASRFMSVRLAPEMMHGQRHAVPVGQQVALGAAFAPVGGVAPGRFRLAGSPLFPERAPSPGTRRRLATASRAPPRRRTPPTGRAHAAAKTPRCTHSWKRAWTRRLGPELARAAPPTGAPVRASQISPSKSAPVVAPRPARLLARLVDHQQGREARPQRVVHPPDRRVVASVRAEAGVRWRQFGRCMHASTLPHVPTFWIGCKSSSAQPMAQAFSRTGTTHDHAPLKSVEHLARLGALAQLRD